MKRSRLDCSPKFASLLRFSINFNLMCVIGTYTKYKKFAKSRGTFRLSEKSINFNKLAFFYFEKGGIFSSVNFDIF